MIADGFVVRADGERFSVADQELEITRVGLVDVEKGKHISGETVGKTAKKGERAEIYPDAETWRTPPPVRGVRRVP